MWMVGTSSAISWFKAGGWHRHELIDDLVHQSQSMILAPVLQSAPAQSGEHGRDTAPWAMVTSNKSCGPPVNLLNLVDVLVKIRVPRRRTVLHSTADERVIGNGLGLLGTIFQVPPDEVESIAGFPGNSVNLLFPE